MTDTKPCSGPCGEVKPLTEFRRDRYAKDGRQSRCKKCRSIGDRIQKLRKRYGLSPLQYDALHEIQDGKCAVCHKRPTTRLEVDHCHGTGRIRGLLCGPCNRALGLFRDDPHTIARAAVYIATSQEARNVLEAIPTEDGDSGSTALSRS